MSPHWYNKARSKKILSKTTEKGQDDSINRIESLLKDLQGTVLEIGPGSGNLLKYLPKHISYICLEPNTFLHNAIKTEAEKCGIQHFKILTARVEHVPLPENSVDAVVSVRSLCTVDTKAATQEIKRILKPNGKLIFTEHVGAHRWSSLWFLQKLVKYPYQLCAGGCDPSKNIGAIIKQAGFSEVQIEEFSKETRLLARPRIAGFAIK